MDKHILKTAIAKWGVETQTKKLQEECLELALVINQMECPTKPDLTDQFIDELADVKIMMAQAEMIIGSYEIDKRVEYKLKRLADKYFNDYNMTKRTRRDAIFYVEQTEGIMKARDKVKKYIRMSEMFPNKSTYLKICGVRYNGERNAKLNDKDLEVLNAGIDTVIEGLKEFKHELNANRP